MTKVPRTHNRERIVYLQMVLEKLIYKCKRIKLVPYLKSYAKINSKWIEGIPLRPEIVKLLDENIVGSLHDFGPVNYFLDMIPKTQETKAKIDVELHKPKDF